MIHMSTDKYQAEANFLKGWTRSMMRPYVFILYTVTCCKPVYYSMYTDVYSYRMENTSKASPPVPRHLCAKFCSVSYISPYTCVNTAHEHRFNTCVCVPLCQYSTKSLFNMCHCNTFQCVTILNPIQYYWMMINTLYVLYVLILHDCYFKT